MAARLPVVLFVCVLGAAAAAWAAEPPSLVKARAAYNAADFEAAIDAAAVARRMPEWADVASLVIARSHIERYRRSANPEDLASAREALVSVNAATLMPRDHVDLVVGLGQALYLGEQFGAAAEVFDTALARVSLLGTSEQQLLLDWWATALDREAQSRPAERRGPAYQRIVERSERALADDPGNPVANYWLAVGARGTGDLDRAWNAAIAAWIRSTLNRGEATRAREDLDRLVSQALIPERARTRLIRDTEDPVVLLREEWDRIKERWK